MGAGDGPPLYGFEPLPTTLPPLTERTRWCLYTALSSLLEGMRNDLDERFEDTDRWIYLCDFPRFTNDQPRSWWIEVFTHGLRLQEGLRTGLTWNPRTPAEEVTLAVVLEAGWCEELLDQWRRDPDAGLHLLPDAGVEDYRWYDAFIDLAGDDDAFLLFDEDTMRRLGPSGRASEPLGMADYRPSQWFEPFGPFVDDPEQPSFLA